MFDCSTHCAVPLAAQEVTGPNAPEMQRQRPPELEELTRLLAQPREALVSLKRQQVAVQAALWEMEESLTRYQSALSSCSLSWPRYEPALAKEEPASVESHNAMVQVNVDEVLDPEQGNGLEDADGEHSPSRKTHLEDLDASISPHTRRLLKKVREQTTLQKQKSLEIPKSQGLWKRTKHACKKLIKKDWFECMISFVIVANSAIIGVDSHLSLPSTGETTKGPGLAWASEAEIFFLVFYSLELAIRAIALQSKCMRDGWFIFDAILVTSAYIEQLLSLFSVQSEQQIMILRLLRLIRLVRTFRMIRQIKSIWRLLYGLLTCGELLISTLALLGMVIYVFAVLGLETIASNQEMREDDNIQRLLDERFSSLGVTMMTLTQFVTLDSLSSLYLPLIKKNAWLMFYFLGLIIIVSIALMNLVTAVLVEGALEHARQDRELEAKVGMVTAKQMLPGILSLFDAVDQDGSGEIVIEEMEKFEQSGLHTVPPHFLDRASVESMTELFDMLDVDKSGRINKDEFTEGILDIFLREVPLSSLQMMKMLRLLHKSTSELEVGLEDVRVIVKDMKSANFSNSLYLST